MNINQHVKDVWKVAFSNFTTLISGVLMGLLLPKMLSVEDFGYYKTFTLYLSYAGLFSLGIVDGIVLDYGNKNYDELNRSLFRGIFKWFICVQLFFVSIIVVLLFSTNNPNTKVILGFLAVNIICNNINGYFQQISQITLRFSEFSYRKIINSVLTILFILLLFIYYKDGNVVSYELFLAVFSIINIILALWYLYTYRDIIRGEASSLLSIYRVIIHLIIIGFPLLFANICSTLMLTLDRQFVNILFDTSTYAVYAFSYNLLSLVTIATSAIAIVIYPILKRSNVEKLKLLYPLLCETVLMFTGACLLLFFFLKVFIGFYLPKYTGSLIIFGVIFPGLSISAVITIVMHNYYKLLGKNIIFFKRSVLVLLLSGVINYLMYIIFKSPLAISIGSVFSLLIWYFSSERFVVKWSGNLCTRNSVYMVIIMLGFYSSIIIQSSFIGASCYLIYYTLISFYFYRHNFRDIILLIKK